MAYPAEEQLRHRVDRQPANAPTTVPLIRMNWRSRPTCSSTLREVSSASHRATVSVINVVISRR